jgi:hypothetical protein
MPQKKCLEKKKRRKRRREMWEKHKKIKEQKWGEIDVG